MSPKPLSRAWRTLRRLLLGILGLAALVALAIAVENWRGRRAWEHFKAEWTAKGVSFDVASVIPPPVPDDQNFAKTPLLAPLYPTGSKTAERYHIALSERLDFSRRGSRPDFGRWELGRALNVLDWQAYLQTNDIAGALPKYQDDLTEISSAASRPFSRFSIQYEDETSVLLPHATVLLQLARLYQLRATVELQQEQSDAAAADVITIMRLIQSMQSEPFLISQLVRIAELHFAIQVVWEDLCRHQWSDEQLGQFAAELGQLDFLSGYHRALNGERLVFFNTTLLSFTRNPPRSLDDKGDKQARVFAHLLPSGWIYQNLIYGNRHLLGEWSPAVNPATRRVFPFQNMSSDTGLPRRSPYNFIALLLLPALDERAAMRFAAAQTAVDEARIACALERYRLARGEYPEALDALVPEYLDKLPHDVFTGDPLKYRRIAPDHFVLYSVGWNGTDDGGQVVPDSTSKSARPDLTRGDWVWDSQPQAVEATGGKP